MFDPMALHHRRCREVRANMSAYLDDELDAATAAGVKRHVRWCPNCRRMLKNLSRTIAGLRALAVTEFSARWSARGRIFSPLRNPLHRSWAMRGHAAS